MFAVVGNVGLLSEEDQVGCGDDQEPTKEENPSFLGYFLHKGESFLEFVGDVLCLDAHYMPSRIGKVE